MVSLGEQLLELLPTRNETCLQDTEKDTTDHQSSKRPSASLTYSYHSWASRQLYERKADRNNLPHPSMIELNQTDGRMFFKRILLGTSKRM